MVPPVYINGKSKISGIFGQPIEHTLSPAMHNAAFAAVGLNWVYLPFLVKPEDLAKATMAIRALNFAGINVTTPHKEAVTEFIDDLDARAKKIGAVNTIRNMNGKLIGYNTDGSGFLTSLRNIGRFEPRGKKAVVIGAGGAARAIVLTLAEAGTRRIVIVNRTKQKAEILTRRIRKFFDCETFAIGLPESRAFFWSVKEADILINATTVGTKNSEMLVNPNSIHKNLLVYDLIYRDTPLVQLARKKNARTMNGKWMLLFQGMESFEIWTGKKAPLKVMSAAITNKERGKIK